MERRYFSQREWLEYLVIGATAGITAGSTVICARLVKDPGDILGFLGGALGAGLAVVGALWIDRRKNDDRQAMLTDSLLAVGVVAGKFRDRAPDMLVSNLLTLRQVIATFHFVRENVGMDNAVAQISMAALVHWFPEITAMIDRHLQMLKNGEKTEAEVKESFNQVADRVFLSVLMTFRGHPYWAKSACDTLAHLRPDLTVDA